MTKKKPEGNETPTPEQLITKLTLYAEPQAKCTGCGSSEVEWMNQFCQMCWESYSSGQWWEMIQTASDQLYSGKIMDNSTMEKEK